MERWGEAKTLSELRTRLEQATLAGNEEEKQQAIGMLALLLGNTVRQQDAALFRDALREIGISVHTKDAKWLLGIVKQDLPPELEAWMDEQIGAIMRGTELDGKV